MFLFYIQCLFGKPRQKGAREIYNNSYILIDSFLRVMFFKRFWSCSLPGSKRKCDILSSLWMAIGGGCSPRPLLPSLFCPFRRLSFALRGPLQISSGETLLTQQGPVQVPALCRVLLIPQNRKGNTPDLRFTGKQNEDALPLHHTLLQFYGNHQV